MAKKIIVQSENDLIRSRSGESTESDHHSHDCFVSDKSHDAVKRVEINYRRTLKIKPKYIPENVKWEYVTWNYNERLSIDSTTDTIEYFRDIGEGCKITSTYFIQEGITDFLNGIDLSVFSVTKGNPPGCS